MLFGVIYKSTCLIPESSFFNKFVIGKKHCKSIEKFNNSKYFGSSKIIKNLVNKHGTNQIKTEVIYQMFDNKIQTSDEKRKSLCDLEKHFIKLYDSQNPEIGMNLTPGGDGFHGKQNEDHKKKRSISMIGKNLGRRHTKETILKLEIASSGKNNGMFGKKHSEESKIKNRKSNLKYLETHISPNKGKKFSKEWKQNMKNSFKNRIYTKICGRCNITFVCKNGRTWLCDNCKTYFKKK